VYGLGGRVDLSQQLFNGRICLKRQVAREELIRDDAEGVEVGASVELITR
jgi:hypothetical protein